MCPRCGRSDRSFIGALCVNCYVEVYGVASIPENLDLTYCKTCGSYKLQGQWVEGSEDPRDTVREYAYIVLSQKLKPTTFIEEAWIEEVDVLENVPGEVMNVKVSIAGRSGSTVASESRIVKVKVNIATCPSCSRKLSKTGYTAIVQVRPVIGGLEEGIRRRLERFLSKQEARVRSSIISIERVGNGFDILVEDQNVARMIASKIKAAFGGYTSETFKVTGVKRGGGRKGILTIAVRISNVKLGDVIAYQGAPHMVIDSSQHGLRLVNMVTGNEVTVEYESLVGVELLNVKDYVGSMLRRLQLSRIEGDNLVFKDTSGGGEIKASIRDTRILKGHLTLGGMYLAYLLGNKLYIVGELGFE